MHLYKAVIRKDYDQLEKLIKAGVDINATDPTGSTALLIAVERHDVKAIKMLVEAGADLDIENCFKYSPRNMRVPINVRNALLGKD